jgi:predicted metal-dependent hydrolase
MKREIVLGDKKVTYTVRVSTRARYMRMTVGDEGLIVTLPHPRYEKFIDHFFREKTSWIIRQLKRFEELQKKEKIYYSKEDYQKRKKEVLNLIIKRVEFFNSLYNFHYRNISIRNQTSVWGSCTRAGNLQFNYKLIYMPPKVLDYVVVHEICHLKEHNHSSRFWDLVSKTVPDHKAIRKLLRGYVMKEDK